MKTVEQIESENINGYGMESRLRNYTYFESEYVKCGNCSGYIEVDENEPVFLVDFFGDGDMIFLCEDCYKVWLSENETEQIFNIAS